MNTTEFTAEYGKTLKGLKDRCIVLDKGAVCCDGVKCDISVSGFKDMADFVSKNSAFFVNGLSEMNEALPRGIDVHDFKMRLCVKNYEGDNSEVLTWGGEAVYANCLVIPYCDCREHVFAKDYEIKDGFVVFDRVRVLKSEKADPKGNEGTSEVAAPKDAEVKAVKCADRDSVWAELANLMGAFNKAKSDKDGSFFKSFSYTMDNDGNVKAEQNINGESKKFVFRHTDGDSAAV